MHLYTMTTRAVFLEVTQEQEETIKALFAHNYWEYKELDQTVKRKHRQKPKRHRQPQPQRSAEPEPELGPEQPNPVAINGECEHCFQNPCVASKEYYWLGNGQGPCMENSALRRVRYASFWKVMTNLGAWRDPRYLAVKITRANGGEWVVQHKREVMPRCILHKLRTLYPNPKDMPYMDHKWK